MKSKYKIGMIMCLAWLISCDNLSDINIDPNNSTTARPKEVLTSVQVYTAYVLDAQFNDLAILWGQYWSWGAGVAISDYCRFIQNPKFGNVAWERSYSDALADIKFLKTSGEKGYSGIAKVLEAFIYQYLVDHFGDIPYSAAIKGAISDGSVLAPTYDDDAVIYPQLASSLDDAILELTAAAADPLVSIGSEDLMYGGDLNSWIKFANSLKLRILMRMSDVVDVSSQVQSTIAFGMFIETPDDIAEIPFSGDAGSESPMYALEESSLGLFYKAASTVTDVMDATNDPRKFIMYDEAENFPGEIKAAAQNQLPSEFTSISADWSSPSAITYGASVPTIFMSNWETWFLRAEAALKYNTGEDASSAFSTAISDNFAYVGAPDADIFSQGLGFDAASTSEKINLIGVQKWISMNGLQEAEGWIEARRFDTPENPIFTGPSGIFQTPLQTALGDREFPVRWLYPESEQSLNPNAPPQSTLTTKVFWDR